MSEKQRKIITIMMFITIGLIGIMFIYSEFFKDKSSNAKEKVEIKDLEIEYIAPDESNKCYLFITNPNDFAVSVEGTIVKYDENKVIDSDAEDEIDITLRSHQVYIMESRNPNNTIARENHTSINFDATLNVKESSFDEEMANNIEIDLELNKENDIGNSLIIYKNDNKKTLDIDGYLVFYTDETKKNISYVSEFTVTDLKGGEEYRDYISVKSSSSDSLNYNYDIYLNDIE